MRRLTSRSTGRLNPRNMQEAYTYQFEDDVKVLRACSLAGGESFDKQLAVLEAHIAAYKEQVKKWGSGIMQRKIKSNGKKD